jgi:hypothetical protein
MFRGQAIVSGLYYVVWSRWIMLRGYDPPRQLISVHFSSGYLQSNAHKIIVGVSQLNEVQLKIS